MILAQKYEKFKIIREPYLKRARKAASLTLPTLIPSEYNNSTTTYDEPNQSVGADGVNNLATKFALTMLPPNDTFYKFDGDRIKLKQEAEATGDNADEIESELNKGLSEIEQYIKNRIEEHGDRIALGEACKHLIVGGNVFLVDDPKNGLKYYPLSRYVVKRDYIGNVLEAITTETVALETLPIDVQEQIINKAQTEGKASEDINEKQFIIYTGFIRNQKKWDVYQEVEGVVLDATKGSYPLDKIPFIASRYTRIDGEDYGRGLIEEYFGDLKQLDTLSKAIDEAALGGARVIGLVNPNGITKIKTLSKTPNGHFGVGRKEDVSFLQAEKYNDLRIANDRADKIERRLSRIFLLSQAVQRDAERVNLPLKVVML